MFKIKHSRFVFEVSRQWAMLVLFALVWELAVRILRIPSYLIPTPTLIVQAFFGDPFAFLWAVFFTLRIALTALVLAVIAGIFIGGLLNSTSLLKRNILPFTVLLQTTPVVAVAPLLLIWFRDQLFFALVVSSWMVCIFPIIAATVTGMDAADPGLIRIARLNNISDYRLTLQVKIPSAIRSILASLRVTAALALIGAVGAEFVMGASGSSHGIAYLLLMAGYNLQVPRLFAGLVVVSIMGIGLFGICSAFARKMERMLFS